jgi:hypothetical protein
MTVANWTAINIYKLPTDLTEPSKTDLPNKKRESRRTFQRPLDLALIRLYAFLERTDGHSNEGTPNYFANNLGPLKETHVSQDKPLQQLRMSDFSKPNRSITKMYATDYLRVDNTRSRSLQTPSNIYYLRQSQSL